MPAGIDITDLPSAWSTKQRHCCAWAQRTCRGQRVTPRDVVIDLRCYAWRRAVRRPPRRQDAVDLARSMNVGTPERLRLEVDPGISSPPAEVFEHGAIPVDRVERAVATDHCDLRDSELVPDLVQQSSGDLQLRPA